MAGRTTYVVLFRGVGGATQLPTAPLRVALTEAGFADVATYINSGNAVLRSDLDRSGVVAAVGDVCREAFGFTKDVYARTRAEWSDLVRKNPFSDRAAEGRLLHAALLGARPEAGRLDALRALATGDEAIEVIGQVAYLFTPGGFSGSKLAERFDRGIGVPNTARNWNTVLRLLDMAGAESAALRDRQA